MKKFVLLSLLRNCWDFWLGKVWRQLWIVKQRQRIGSCYIYIYSLFRFLQVTLMHFYLFLLSNPGPLILLSLCLCLSLSVTFPLSQSFFTTKVFIFSFHYFCFSKSTKRYLPFTVMAAEILFNVIIKNN